MGEKKKKSYELGYQSNPHNLFQVNWMTGKIYLIFFSTSKS